MDKLNRTEVTVTINDMVEGILKNQLIVMSLLVVIRDNAVENEDSEETIKNIEWLMYLIFRDDILELGNYYIKHDFPDKEDIKLEIQDYIPLMDEIKERYKEV
jgi:DNA-directed RNA polymerase subunit L